MPRLALVLALVFATSAQARPPLAQVNEISEGLIAVGMALELSKKCPSVEARTLRGAFRLNGLRVRARELGYSKAEIDAYVGDKTEKARLERVARDRLAALGAEPGNVAGHCTVARQQIAARTAIGTLLK